MELCERILMNRPLLVAALGILFFGCGEPGNSMEEFTYAEFMEKLDQDEYRRVFRQAFEIDRPYREGVEAVEGGPRFLKMTAELRDYLEARFGKAYYETSRLVFYPLSGGTGVRVQINGTSTWFLTQEEWYERAVLPRRE